MHNVSRTPMNVIREERDSCPLDIDNGMVIVEDIIARYIHPEEYTGNVWYMRGNRYPLTSRKDIERYKKFNLIRNTPWHPYLSIPLLADILEYYQYKHATSPKLFKTNPGGPSATIYTTTPNISDTTIIKRYVDNISDEDLLVIANLFLEMYNKCFKDIFISYPDSVYTLCAETNMYQLIRHDDIRAYRLNELLAARML